MISIKKDKHENEENSTGPSIITAYQLYEHWDMI